MKEQKTYKIRGIAIRTSSRKRAQKIYDSYSDKKPKKKKKEKK
jgi:ribosomal protein L20A (L18A)